VHQSRHVTRVKLQCGQVRGEGARQFAAALHREPGWLVEHEEVLVAVEHPRLCARNLCGTQRGLEVSARVQRQSTYRGLGARMCEVRGEVHVLTCLHAVRGLDATLFVDLGCVRHEYLRNM
jgi:hypothetical protein